MSLGEMYLTIAVVVLCKGIGPFLQLVDILDSCNSENRCGEFEFREPCKQRPTTAADVGGGAGLPAI